MKTIFLMCAVLALPALVLGKGPPKKVRLTGSHRVQNITYGTDGKNNLYLLPGAGTATHVVKMEKVSGATLTGKHAQNIVERGTRLEGIEDIIFHDGNFYQYWDEGDKVLRVTPMREGESFENEN